MIFIGRICINNFQAYTNPPSHLKKFFQLKKFKGGNFLKKKFIIKHNAYFSKVELSSPRWDRIPRTLGLGLTLGI